MALMRRAVIWRWIGWFGRGCRRGWSCLRRFARMPARCGSWVGLWIWCLLSVRARWFGVRRRTRLPLGMPLGMPLGLPLGMPLGMPLGLPLGMPLGMPLGLPLGMSLGMSLGLPLGMPLGLP